MSKIHLLVEQALQKWEETRDSDKKLMLAVWYLQDPCFEQHFKQFFKEKAATPESITRVRRKLQEQGKYQASKKVDDERFNKFNNMRNYGNYSVEDIDNTLI
jgi:4-alpha-glucanotransferase